MSNDMNGYTLRYTPGGCSCSANANGEAGCRTLTCDLSDMNLEQDGHILEVNGQVCEIFPGRRVAVAVMVHELDERENEHARGMKTFTLPAHHEQGCRDIRIENVRFALPEDISLSRGCACRRRFVVRAFAHYTDDNCGCTGE